MVFNFKILRIEHSVDNFEVMEWAIKKSKRYVSVLVFFYLLKKFTEHSVDMNIGIYEDCSLIDNTQNKTLHKEEVFVCSCGHKHAVRYEA